MWRRTRRNTNHPGATTGNICLFAGQLNTSPRTGRVPEIAWCGQAAAAGIQGCPSASRTTLDAQIREGLVEEIAELDRRYRLVEQARRPGRRRNVASQTHRYREFARVAASTGKAIAELDGADLAAARAEALGHIRAYSRQQRSWFRKLGASRVDHRSAVKTMLSRLQ